MWAQPDVCGLFSNNVVKFSVNPVISTPLFSANVVTRTCLFVVLAPDVCGSLQLGAVPKRQYLHALTCWEWIGLPVRAAGTSALPPLCRLGCDAAVGQENSRERAFVGLRSLGKRYWGSGSKRTESPAEGQALAQVFRTPQGLCRFSVLLLPEPGVRTL